MLENNVKLENSMSELCQRSMEIAANEDDLVARKLLENIIIDDISHKEFFGRLR